MIFKFNKMLDKVEEKWTTLKVDIIFLSYYILDSIKKTDKVALSEDKEKSYWDKNIENNDLNSILQEFKEYEKKWLPL